MRARSIGVMALLALGCGKSADKQAPARSADAAVAAAADAGAPLAAPLGALAGRLPTLTGDAVMPLAPPPVAVVSIDEHGSLRVAASGGSWANLVAADFAAVGARVESVAALPAALLTILEAAEPTAEAARAMREELVAEATGTEPEPAPEEEGEDEAEVSVAYAAEAGAPLPPATPLVIAHPAAPAQLVVEVLDRTGGALAVGHGATVRVFRIGFPWENAGWGGATLADEDTPSVDVHLGPGLAYLGGGGFGAELEQIIVEATTDPAEVTQVLERQGGGAAATPAPSLDLLVAPGTSAQTLIDALSLLDRASKHRLGIASTPWEVGLFTGADLTGPFGQLGGAGGSHGGIGAGYGRGEPKAPVARLGQVTVAGDLDRTIIRRYVKRVLGTLRACYQDQLVADPALAGTVSTTLVISEDGAVASVESVGVSPAVSTCIAAVVRAIEFPDTSRQGVVRAKFPITFRPTGE